MRPSDDWIDETARALTEGEPGADFKARVLARIEEARPVRWFAPWRIAVASAVMAVVVIAIVVLGVRGPADAPTQVRLKPDTTAATVAGDVRLKADATAAQPATAAVRLKPDTTAPSFPRAAVLRNAARGESNAYSGNDAPPIVPGPAPIEVADIPMRPLDVVAIDEPDPMITGDIPIASIDVLPLASQFD